MILCIVPPKTGFTKEEGKQNWTLATITPTLVTSKWVTDLNYFLWSKF